MNAESRYLYALIVLVLIGTIAGVVLIAIGQPLSVVTAVNAPIVGVGLVAVVAKLQGLEKKVNGQLNSTRTAAYSAGYAHGAQGLTPRHPLTLTDHEAVVEAQKP